jgi:hypothetical protein
MRTNLPARGAALLALLCCACSNSSENPGAGASKASAAGGLHFTDVLDKSGIRFEHHFLDSETGTTFKINPYDHGSGVAVADVDGDGREDVYFLDFLGSNALYLNKGGMRFEDVTAKAGVAVSRSLSVGAVFGDYDNDGDPDLFVTTYRGGNHLFQNDGKGVFSDVTQASGVAYTGHSSAATWLDYDNDGDLDLYLCNIGSFTKDTISKEADFFYEGVSLPFSELAKAPEQLVKGEPDILYRNEGQGRFTDVTEAAGIRSVEWNADVAVADIDLDGDLDLYVSNMFGENHLYRNRGDGSFEDIAREALGRTSWGGMGARFFDANGDEYPDLYVVDMHSDMWVDAAAPAMVVADAKFNTPLGSSVVGGKQIATPDDTVAPHGLFGNTFFVNRGGAAFDERSKQSGLENFWPWSITTGDYDADGDEDIFVAGGMGFPFFYWPNYFYVNDGKAVFAEQASAVGIEPPARGELIGKRTIRGHGMPRSSRAAASADFDGDGDLDIVVNNFNHEPYLLRNDSPKGNCLRLSLVGKRAARDAYGTRVQVSAGGKTWHRWISASEGYLCQNSRILHIGLGDVSAVDEVQIHWLGQPEPQVVTAPEINTVVEIVQE